MSDSALKSVLIIRFEQAGKVEERTYDFKYSEARKAFVRFVSHALQHGIIFSGTSAETAKTTQTST